MQVGSRAQAACRDGAVSGQGGSPVRLAQQSHIFLPASSSRLAEQLASGGTAWASCSDGSLLLGCRHGLLSWCHPGSPRYLGSTWLVQALRCSMAPFGSRAQRLMAPQGLPWPFLQQLKGGSRACLEAACPRALDRYREQLAMTDNSSGSCLSLHFSGSCSPEQGCWLGRGGWLCVQHHVAATVSPRVLGQSSNPLPTAGWAMGKGHMSKNYPVGWVRHCLLALW